MTSRKDTEVIWSARKDFYNLQIKTSSTGSADGVRTRNPNTYGYMVIHPLHSGHDRMPLQCSSPQQNQTLPFLSSWDPWSVHHPPLNTTRVWSQGTEACFNFISQPFTCHCKRTMLTFEHFCLVGKEPAPSDTNCSHVSKKEDSWYLNKVLLKSQSLSFQTCSTLKQSLHLNSLNLCEGREHYLET